MKLTSALLFAALSASTFAAPLQKRIAQNISDSTKAWQDACLAAKGGEQCNPIAVNAFGTLLAAPGPCEQQDAADTMIDLAKKLGNDAEMIRLAQIFAQQPRNSPTSLGVPYCQTAPRNAELNGLFQCQFAGTDKNTFVSSPANLKVGDKGTIPLGLNAPVSPPGSCPANPSGPVPDGQQLVDIVGKGSSGAGAAGGNNGSAGGAAGNNDSDSGDDETDENDCEVTVTVEPTATATATATSAPAATATAPAGNGATDFQTQNKKDAQALNAKFATLTKDSKCTAGENACINGQFAQCVGSSFVTTACAPSTQCFALPLVNSKGTSITCSTQQDAEARIGGSITGN